MGFDENGGGGANVPDWTEDGNSPFSASNFDTTQFAFSETFDIWWIFAEVTNNAASQEQMGLRVDGDSGSNYDHVTFGGTTTTNDTEWPEVLTATAGNTSRGAYLLAGRFTSECSFGHHGLTGTREDAHVAAGNNKNISSPLDSVTWVTTQNADATITMEAYGRDIG